MKIILFSLLAGLLVGWTFTYGMYLVLEAGA